ncbi:hypothetical protein VPHK469_0135 [Vibrio phage K469]
MKKFYVFTAGEAVPKWMFNFECSDVAMHKNKSGKITFGRSVIAVRDPSAQHTALIPATGGEYYIKLSGFDYAKLGGVKGATGVAIRTSEHERFGRGLVYKLGNSGKPTAMYNLRPKQPTGV